jgi:uncharacterized protein (TIGR02453 family)
MTFRGFPPEALAFFAGLEADNSKRYWEANKAVYEASVRGPMVALIEEAPIRWQPMRIFRPQRDTRFSKDKSPYKTGIAAVGEREGGAISYVQVSSSGLFAGVGYYHMASDQLERYRSAVNVERTGRKLESIVAALEQAKWDIGGEELKTAPRGYARDHPRIELLRKKGMVLARQFPLAKWLHTRATAARVFGVWEAAEPLSDWLDANVGPTTLAPDDLDR